MQAILLQDIITNKREKGKEYPIYGKKREVVEVVSIRENVLIVEGKWGKYSVTINDIRILNN